jgi:hypothetical protein
MVADLLGRQTPEGYGAQTALPAGARSVGRTGVTLRDTEQIRLSPESTATLRSFAAANKLDLPSIICAAWAILLSRYSGEDDVAFGILHGPSNIVPVRLRVSGEQPLLPWLASVAKTLESRGAAATPPSFETAISFHASEIAHDLPLLLSVNPSSESELQIVAHFDRSRFLEGALPHILGQAKTILEHIALARTGEPVSAVPLTPRLIFEAAFASTAGSKSRWSARRIGPPSSSAGSS